MEHCGPSQQQAGVRGLREELRARTHLGAHAHRGLWLRVIEELRGGPGSSHPPVPGGPTRLSPHPGAPHAAAPGRCRRLSAGICCRHEATQRLRRGDAAHKWQEGAGERGHRDVGTWGHGDTWTWRHRTELWASQGWEHPSGLLFLGYRGLLAESRLELYDHRVQPLPALQCAAQPRPRVLVSQIPAAWGLTAPWQPVPMSHHLSTMPHRNLLGTSGGHLLMSHPFVT